MFSEARESTEDVYACSLFHVVHDFSLLPSLRSALAQASSNLVPSCENVLLLARLSLSHNSQLGQERTQPNSEEDRLSPETQGSLEHPRLGAPDASQTCSTNLDKSLSSLGLNLLVEWQQSYFKNSV